MSVKMYYKMFTAIFLYRMRNNLTALEIFCEPVNKEKNALGSFHDFFSNDRIPEIPYARVG